LRCNYIGCDKKAEEIGRGTHLGNFIIETHLCNEHTKEWDDWINEMRRINK
jgi:hypothetical protein